MDLTIKYQYVVGGHMTDLPHVNYSPQNPFSAVDFQPKLDRSMDWNEK